MNRNKQIIWTALFFLLLALTTPAQGLSDLERDRAKMMLRTITQDVKKHYYDEKLQGVDFDGRIREAEARIEKATNLGQTMAIIAWSLDILGDSHTYFAPPSRTSRHDYGWRMQMVGAHCYVTQVRPKSDAELKGLKPGDEILSVNGITPDRDNFHNIKYLFNVLRPLPVMRLQVRSPEGQQRQLEVAAKIVQLKRAPMGMEDFYKLIRESENEDWLMRTRCVEILEAQICRMAEFNLEYMQINDIISSARKKKGMILDLRGNPGGSVDVLEQMVGGFLEHDVKISDRVGRKTLKPLLAKSKGSGSFTGTLVVLVDSNSASAAELFAREMQLEKRAKVIGDRSSGLVMEGRFHDYKIGADVVIFYGALITDADLIMSDGKSLERNGVMPDEIVLPTAADLANHRDPALARAAELLGINLSPEAAGKLFPFEWKNL